MFMKRISVLLQKADMSEKKSKVINENEKEEFWIILEKILEKIY